MKQILFRKGHWTVRSSNCKSPAKWFYRHALVLYFLLHVAGVNAFLFLKLTNRIHIMKPSRLEPLVVDLLFVNYTLHQSTSLNMSQYAMKGTDCKQRYDSYDSCQMFGALQNSFRMLKNMSLNESSLSGSCGSVCSSQRSVRNKCGMSCKLVGGREREGILFLNAIVVLKKECTTVQLTLPSVHQSQLWKTSARNWRIPITSFHWHCR